MNPPGDRQKLLECLRTAEKRAQVLSAALLEGQPELVAAAAQDMQQSAQALSASLHGVLQYGPLEPVLKQRLRRVGQVLAMQREACLRRAAVVDRALNSIIPSSRANTYSGGAGPYGQQARRSGAFNLMAA